MTEEIRSCAEQLKELLIEISPLIEEYTAMVCPGCRDVCCRQEHGTFKKIDKIYHEILGTSTPRIDPSRDPRSPCRFMGPAGCIQPRWLRPLKCTWFFCESLLTAMNEGPQKKARTLSKALQNIVDLVRELEKNETTSQGKHF